MARAPSTFRPQAAACMGPEAPRGLTVKAAADYAGCRTVSAFRDWVRKGIMPRPLPGTHRYDRKAIDVALDRMSGLSATKTELSEYAAWKQRNANTPQGH
jgi:hypothetical protein